MAGHSVPGRGYLEILDKMECYKIIRFIHIIQLYHYKYIRDFGDSLDSRERIRKCEMGYRERLINV